MRWVPGVLVVLASGCVTPETRTTTVMSRRVLFGTSPMAPQGLSGSSGIGLTAQVMAGDAKPTGPGSGVGFAVVQPNVGTVFKIDDWYVGGHFSFATGTLGSVRASPEGASVSENQVAWETVVLLGRDLAVSRAFGFNLSAEFGVSSSSLRSSSSLGAFESPLIMPALRGGFGVYGNPVAPLRLFAGVAVTSTPWNTPTSIITQTCVGSCSATDSGVASLTAVGLAGGGVRWQLVRGVSLGAEAWVPFTQNSAALPLQVLATLRLGDFAFTPSAKKELSPPPPPPDVAPLPPPPAPPLGV